MVDAALISDSPLAKDGQQIIAATPGFCLTDHTHCRHLADLKTLRAVHMGKQHRQPRRRDVDRQKIAQAAAWKILIPYFRLGAELLFG